MKWIPFDFTDISPSDISQQISNSIIGVRTLQHIRPIYVNSVDEETGSVHFNLVNTGLEYQVPRHTQLFRPVLTGKRWYLTDKEPVLVSSVPARQWSRGLTNNTVVFRDVQNDVIDLSVDLVNSLMQSVDRSIHRYQIPNDSICRTNGTFLMCNGRLNYWRVCIATYNASETLMRVRTAYTTLIPEIRDYMRDCGLAMEVRVE